MGLTRRSRVVNVSISQLVNVLILLRRKSKSNNSKPFASFAKSLRTLRLKKISKTKSEKALVNP
jgi:hypothetical protein